MLKKLCGGPISRALAAFVLLAFVPMASTACFGSFGLTRKVYEFNRTVSADKWTRWIIFVLMGVFWVYGAAVFIDVVFANSVEFWGGQNPFALAPGTTRVAHGPDGAIVRFTVRSAGRIEFELREPSGTTHTIQLAQEEDGVAAFDDRGRLIGSVRDLGGRAVFSRATGSDRLADLR